MSLGGEEDKGLECSKFIVDQAGLVPMRPFVFLPL